VYWFSSLLKAYMMLLVKRAHRVNQTIHIHFFSYINIFKSNLKISSRCFLPSFSRRNK